MSRRYDDISGSGGGKASGSASAPSETPNNLFSNAVARVIDVLGEGPIGGLCNGASSIYLDDTPLKTRGGGYNFRGVAWEQRYGLPDQDPLPYSGVESEVLVSVEVTKALPVTRQITDTDIDDVRIKVLVPALYKIAKDKGGDIKGSRVQLDVSIRPAGSSEWQSIRIVNINGKSNAPYERAVKIRNIRQYGDGPWEIRISRLTDDATESHIVDKTYWSSYTTIINERFIWPDVALVGIEIEAQQFGSHIPTRSYEVFGRNTLRIPTNYNPRTRKYSGVWDGTFTTGYTNNPAWCWYDMLTDERYGLGRYIDASRVDKWSVYQVAKYCDELVPDGYGGMEPRFELNYCFQSQEDAIHMLGALASAFLAQTYYGSGMATLVQDAPQDASFLATPANVIGGQFIYSGSGLKTRYSVAMVSWNDPKDAYRPAVEVVVDDELIQKIGWRKSDILAVGCTRRSQAIRMGRWLLDSQKCQTEIVMFRAGMDFAGCVPGCIVQVQDPHYAGVRNGGRLQSGSSTSSIKLDAPVTIESGETYKLTIAMPDGSLQERPVISSPGTTSTLTTQAFQSSPPANSVWVLWASNVAPRQFRVVRVSETSDTEYEITALIHDPTKYARVYENIVLDPDPDTIIPTDPIAAITGLDAKVFGYQDGNNWKIGVLVSWVLSDDPRIIYYDIEWREGDGGWDSIGQTSSNSLEKRGVSAGVYDFRVRGRGIGTSPWTVLTGVSVAVPDVDVPAVTGLQVIGGGTTFSGPDCEVVWNSVRGQDWMPEGRFLDYKVIVMGTGGSVQRTEFVQTERYTYTLSKNQKDFGANTPARTFKVAVYARDIYERESAPAEATFTNPAPSMEGYSPSVVGLYTGIRVDWSAYTPPDNDLAKYVVLCDTVSPPVQVAGEVGANTQLLFIPLHVDDAQSYYLQVVPYDEFGVGVGSEMVGGEVDPSWILDVLQGRITEGELFQALAGRLDGIEANRARIELIGAQATIKVDANGNVAGIGLIAYPYWSESNTYSVGDIVTAPDQKVYHCILGNIDHQPPDATYWEELAYQAKSDFLVYADRFAVVQPGAPGDPPKIPFVVGLVGGQSKVGIDGDLIVDGTIQGRTLASSEIITMTAQIKDAIITDAKISSLDASKITSGFISVARLENPQGSGTIFQDYFDLGFHNWSTYRSTNPTITNPEGSGLAGGRVLQVRYGAALEHNGLIPFDSTKLYRMRVRIRNTTRPSDTSRNKLFIGVSGFGYNESNELVRVNRSGNNSTLYHYDCVCDDVDLQGVSLNTWVEYTGYFRGHGAHVGNAGNPSNPCRLHANVRYIRPRVWCNHEDGDGRVQIDFVAIDVIPISSDLPIGLDGLPVFTPGYAGLFLTGDYMGYHDGSGWQAYIAKDGKFRFGGSSTNRIDWNGTTLSIRGALTADDIVAGSITTGQLDSQAATGRDSASVSSYQLTGTGWNSIASFALSLVEGSYLLIGAKIGIHTSSPSPPVEVRVRQGSSNVLKSGLMYRVDYAPDGQGGWTTVYEYWPIDWLFHVNLGLTGSRTFYLDARTTAAPTYVGPISLVVVEIKR